MLTRYTVYSALTALTAALLLACAVSAASARNLSTSNQNIRVTWRNIEAQAEVATVRCPLTLEGSFHTRTITKVIRSLAGAITRAMINQAGCTNGIGAMFNGTERYNGTTSPNTLPWHMTYEGFSGRLPSIESFQMAVSRFRYGINVNGGLGCTAQFGSETDSITSSASREAGGGIVAIAPIAGRNVTTKAREDSDPFDQCPNTINMAGSSTSITLLGAATRISITLI